MKRGREAPVAPSVWTSIIGIVAREWNLETRFNSDETGSTAADATARRFGQGRIV